MLDDDQKSLLFGLAMAVLLTGALTALLWVAVG